MDEIFNPIIINGKKAEEHLGKIRQEHSSLLEGLMSHQMKVGQFNMEKDMERKMIAEENRKNQFELQKQSHDNEQKTFDRNNDMQKTALENDFRTKELEIRQMEMNKTKI